LALIRRQSTGQIRHCTFCNCRLYPWPDAATPAAQECARSRIHAESFSPDHPICSPPVSAAGLSVIAVCQRLHAPDRQRFIAQMRDGQPQEFLQTSVDRMATLAMRDNLNSLYLLMGKLYLRNPEELRKSGFLDINTAVQQVRLAIEQQQPLPVLGGARSGGAQLCDESGVSGIGSAPSSMPSAACWSPPTATASSST
jgi:hypothetical protein